MGDLGLLVGKLSMSKSIYEYVVIPNRDDIDAMEATPPSAIMKERYVVNTRGVADFLKGLYLVEYKWRRSVTQNGPLDKAYISNKYQFYPVDINNPLDSVRGIDPDASYHIFEEPPIIDSDFLTNLSRSVGTGANLPKRFLSSQMATVVEDGDKKIPLLINIIESYIWMQENPSKLRGVIIIPSYKIAVIVADPITKEELKDEILSRINASLSAFRNDYMRAGILSTGEEEED